ncbi:hypothetical protein acdb102_11390 [Acidothermaceae bacterium B102]|nr:hypothetical protein acdb102_11390 [Acidothermaceae bacterium B102]
MRAAIHRGRGARHWRAALTVVVALLTCLASVSGFAPPAAAAAAPPLLTVTCTATVSYGGDLTCWAASTDVNGDFAEAGTFTFDKAQALPATWTAKTCVVNKSQCEVDATLATPPGAQPRTVVFVVGFKGADGATVSTAISVDLTLRPTVTQLVCDQSGLPLGGSTHCVVGVADQLYAWDSHPAQLGPGVAGLTVTSSAPGDTVTYDKPAPGGASCLAAVVDSMLSCGLTLAADQVPGLRALTATYPGDPVADEQPSSVVLRVANGPRIAPILSLTCPAAVPARSPVGTCQVSVQATGPGLLVPTGAVAFDQDSGQPVNWADSQVCQLDAGTCSVPISVFADWSSGITAPIRASYAGDDGYLPATADQQVDVTPTATTSQIACDNPSPAAGSLLHCELTFSTVDGGPVPVGPLDAIFVSTSEGTVTCDVDAGDGCGHVNTPTATVAGFSLQLDQTTGPQLLIGEYTGDDFDMVAGSTVGFSWVVPGPPVVTPQPAPVPPSKATTTTAIACAGPVAYRHATQCTVAVTSSAGVPSGTVTVSPAAGSPAFAAASCTLTTQGLCTVSVASQALPGAVVSLAVAYSGSDASSPSTGTGAFTIHAVPTTVGVHCSARAAVRPGAVVSCVASVRTRYGTAAAPPPAHASQVTVNARGDAIVYTGPRTSRSCHWVAGAQGLTCHFSVRAGHARGLRLVKVHYTGTFGTTHDAASVGQASFTVKSS